MRPIRGRFYLLGMSGSTKNCVRGCGQSPLISQEVCACCLVGAEGVIFNCDERYSFYREGPWCLGSTLQGRQPRGQMGLPQLRVMPLAHKHEQPS